MGIVKKKKDLVRRKWVPLYLYTLPLCLRPFFTHPRSLPPCSGEVVVVVARNGILALSL